MALIRTWLSVVGDGRLKITFWRADVLLVCWRSGAVP